MRAAGNGPLLSTAMKTAAANTLVKKIQARAPKKSGALAASIYVTDKKPAGEQMLNQEAAMGYIVVDTFYARFQEYGSQHQPARPFVRPVLDAEQKEFYDNCTYIVMTGLKLACLAFGQPEISLAISAAEWLTPIDSQVSSDLQVVGKVGGAVEGAISAIF